MIEEVNPFPPPPRKADRNVVDRQLRDLLEHERSLPPGRVSHYNEKGEEVEGRR